MLACKFLVIGAGQTGLYVATSLAKQGWEVILVEENDLGGSYLYSSDLPKKILSQFSQDFYATFQTLKDESETTLAALEERRGRLSQNIYQKIRSQAIKIQQEVRQLRNLKVIYGKAEFQSKSLVEVKSETERQIISFGMCVLTVGRNQMKMAKIKGIDEVDFLYQHNAFFLEEIPQKLAILECTLANLQVANIYANLGVQVSIFEQEYAENILKNVDPSCLNYYFQKLLEKGVEFFFGCNIVKVEKTEDSSLEIFDDEKNSYSFSHLYAHVRESFSDQMNLAKIGIRSDSAGIITGPGGQTNHRNIWALGHCNSQWREENYQTHLSNFLQKHKPRNGEERAGKSTALVLFSSVSSMIASDEIRDFPFTIIRSQEDPHMATIGLTYKEAGGRYGSQIKLEIWRSREVEGFVKLIFNDLNNQLLGVALAGKLCQELYSSAIIALQKNLSYKDYRSYLRALYILEQSHK